MIERVDSIERRTCRHVAKLAAKNLTLEQVQDRYKHARDYWASLVWCGDGSTASGEVIAEATAEVNALARIAASKGLRELKELH